MNLIDTLVYIGWNHADDITPYLDATWRHRWRYGGGHTSPGLRIRPKYYDPDIPSGMTPGPQVTDPVALEADWRLPHKLDALILNIYDASLISTYGDVDYPTAVASAVNRWMEAKFLTVCPHVYGSITVATQDPQAAAREIRRAAQHPQMVEVVLPAGTRLPYGHRWYTPIYEAAAECGLSVMITAGTEGIGTSNPPTPNGWPGTTAEMTVVPATNALCHITSLVTEGVFARWPQLRFVFAGTGAAWLPPYLWRFDKNYKALRSECPWVRELPSELVCRHIRFITQGVGPVEPPEAFWRLLGSVPGSEQLLMYGSGYPRFGMESPGQSFVLGSVTTGEHAAVAATNALMTYPRLASIAARAIAS